MTPKEKRFCDEYIVDYNAAAAARRAGFSERAARQYGHGLLKEAPIKARIAELQAEQADRVKINADRNLVEMACIAYANMADFIGPDGLPITDFSQLTREQAAALSEITVEEFTEGRGDDARRIRRLKFKLHDKTAAQAKIGQFLGMFIERKEITGKDGGPVRVDKIERVIVDPKVIDETDS